MARRGEGQWVAMECGFHGDPRKCGRIVRLLKVSENEAYGIVGRWRELVLTRGEGLGVLREYPAADIADWCGWKGKPEKLIAALQDANELASRRGVYRHPYWRDTPTGEFAAYKSTERDRKAEERATRKLWDALRPGEGWPGLDAARKALSGQSADGPEPVRGPGGDVLRKGGHKGTNGVRGAPQGAPRGGAAERLRRWEWFEANYPLGVEDPEECAAILGALSDEDWQHVQFGLRVQASNSRWKHTPFRIPPARRWLKRREWRRTKWKPGQKLPEPKGNKAPVVVPSKPSADELELQRRLFEKRAEVKQHLSKEKGLRGAELLSAIDAEMEKFQQQQGGSPS